MFSDLFSYACIIGVTVLVYRGVTIVNAAFRQTRRQEEQKNSRPEQSK